MAAWELPSPDVAPEPSDPTALEAGAAINVACEPRDSLVAARRIGGPAEAPDPALPAAKDTSAEASAAKLSRLGMDCAQARLVFSGPLGPRGFSDFTAGKDKGSTSALFVSRVALQYRLAPHRRR